MANFFSKIFSGLKNVVKKIGKGIGKLFKKVKKFTRRAFRKGKQWIKENPWFWQMALTIAMPYITEFAVGSLKTGMSALAKGTGKGALDAQWVKFRAGTGLMPTWTQIGQGFAAGAEATLPQKIMGWALQAPAKLGNTITGAINNGWNWVTDLGKKVFGVSSDGALADQFSAFAGTDGLIDFGKYIEAQNYQNPFGTVGAAVDLTDMPLSQTAAEHQAYATAMGQPEIRYDFPEQPVSAVQRFELDPERGRYVQYEESLLAPATTPRDRPRADSIKIDPSGQVRRAQPPTIQYEVPGVTTPEQQYIEDFYSDPDFDATAYLGYDPAAPKKVTLGEQIVQGAMRGGRQLAQDWITGLGQDVPGSALGGGYLIDLLAWNNPSIYDEFDLMQQNSGNYFGGAAYAANTQNILPEDSYYKDMPDLNKLTAPPLLRV